MRIPFIRRVNDPSTLIRPELEVFIRRTRGGSPFLVAGGLFWLIGALVSVTAPDARVIYIIFGGIFVPVAAIFIGPMMRASWLIRSPYAVLAAIAPFMELAAIPIMIFLRDDHVGALPGILMICEGVHYLVYMWIHMEYYYFILAYLKAFLGILFLFDVLFADSYGPQLLISGILSIIAASLIARDGGRVMAIYTKRTPQASTSA